MNELNVKTIDELKQSIDVLINDIKVKRENILKEIFQNVKDELLPEIYATAMAYKKPMTSCVYFIQNNYTGRIKIGSANNLLQRYKELKRAFNFVGLDANLKLIALKLTFPEYVRKLEQSIHKDYEDYKFMNEWYDIEADKVINDCTDVTDKIDFINDVLIDFSEIEYPFYKKIRKDFTISRDSIKNELGLAKNNDFKSVVSMLLNENNPLWEIVDTVNEYKVGFCAEFYDTFSNLTRTQGVKYTNSDEVITFQELKLKKYDRKYWEEIISEINNYC